MIYTNRSTGLIPQFVDDRDYIYKKQRVTGESKIQTINMKELFPPVTFQNGYESCGAHAVCALLDYTMKYKKKYTSWEMNTSEAYLWYYGRKRLGKEKQNSGTVLRDLFKVIRVNGWVPQDRWDYKDGIYVEPNIKGDFFAQLYLNQLPDYYGIGIGDEASIINALNNNSPVVFGMPTDINYQKLGSDAYVDEIQGSQGFHAQLIVGYCYRGDTRYYIVRNSWGSNWGYQGYSFVNSAIVKNQGFDFWTLL